MPRSPTVATQPPGTTPQVPNTVISSAVWNAAMDDIYQIFNTPQPIEYGGTNATTAAGARTNLEAVSYASQTLTAAEQVQARANISVRREFISFQTVSAVSAIDFTGLSAFRELYVSFSLTVSTTTAIYWRGSSDNGSSWLSGASDYKYRGSEVEGVTQTNSQGDTSAGFLHSNTVLSNAAAPCSARASLMDFNSAIRTTYFSEAYYNKASSAIERSEIAGTYTPATALNALRIFASTGNLTGYILLEGARN